MVYSQNIAMHTSPLTAHYLFIEIALPPPARCALSVATTFFSGLCNLE